MKKQQSGKQAYKADNRNAQKSQEPALPKEEMNIFQKFWQWRKDRKRKIEEARKKPQTFSESLWSWAKTIAGAIIVVMIINGLAIASFVVPTESMERTVLAGDFLFVDKFSYGPSTPQVIPFIDVPLPFYKFPGIKSPERGDVIVFIFPGNLNDVEPPEFQYYLKRCVAIGGDTVLMAGDKLYVNGEVQPLSPHGQYLNLMEGERTLFPSGYGFSRDAYGPLRVPKIGDTIIINDSTFESWKVFIGREGHEAKLRGSKVYIDGTETDKYIVERDYCFGVGDNRNNSLDSRYWGFIPVDDVVGSPIMVYWSWDTGLPLSKIIDKIASVRWGRIGTFID